MAIPEDEQRRLAEEPMLKWFEHEHLPDDLRAVSSRFQALAWSLVLELPRCAERTVALRKLLEAKDAGVRCAIDLRYDLRRAHEHADRMREPPLDMRGNG